MNVTPKFLENELDTIFQDIRPDAIKIGMVSDSNLIKSIVKKLKEYDAKNIVVDPVMVATSGAKLISDEAKEVLVKELIPIADVITPNIPEAMVLSNMEIKDKNDMEESIKILSKLGAKSVLLKGGHSINDANDLFYDGKDIVWINGKRIDNPNTHGTGCTLSSAIATYLAKGYSKVDAIKNAKTYLSKCLEVMLDLGKGSGPLNHGFILGDINYND